MAAILITTCDSVSLFQRFIFQNTNKYKLIKWNNAFVFIKKKPTKLFRLEIGTGYR